MSGARSLNEFDVVVVGCGVAGLAAAVAAAEAGARVAVLERATREERGGQSRYTEAYLRMKSGDAVTDDFETHLAENQFPYPDPDLIQDLARAPAERLPMTHALQMLGPDVIEAFAAAVGPTVDWLRARGVRFDFLPTQFLTKAQPRLLPIGGGLAIVEALAARAESLGVAFFYETTARALDVDVSGRVVGVRAMSRGRGVLHLRGAVVLACGGFEGNPELMTRYVGPRSVYLRPVCKGGYLNRGEGIEMALAIGAAPSGDFGSYHAEPVDPRSGVSEPSVFIFPYGILVNREGRRFTDEAPGPIDATYERVTREIYAQSAGLAYVILDERHREIPNFRLALRTDQPPIVAPTIEALAARLDMPGHVLVHTVEAYNRACPSQRPFRPLEVDGTATDAALHPGKSNWAYPLDRPPFAAYPIVSSNVFTFGGLKVDAYARVLDLASDPIDGLYAAGETIGLYYQTYTGATSVLKGLVFGRAAGAHAALLEHA